MSILHELSGGDRRSIGRSNEIVRRVLADPSLFDAVYSGMSSRDPVVRARAANAVGKITRERPRLLVPYKKGLLQQAAVEEQPAVRWHAAQMLGRLPMRSSGRSVAVETLLRYLDDLKPHRQDLCPTGPRRSGQKRPRAPRNGLRAAQEGRSSRQPGHAQPRPQTPDPLE